VTGFILFRLLPILYAGGFGWGYKKMYELCTDEKPPMYLREIPWRLYLPLVIAGLFWWLILITRIIIKSYESAHNTYSS
jgi:hypothetical protein